MTRLLYMVEKGKALILGRLTDGLWVEVRRWAGSESRSQVKGVARITGYSTRMEAGSRGSVATKAWCRAAGRAPRRRRDRTIAASGHLGHGSLGLGREAERVEESYTGWVEGHGEEGDG
jgi:hypothetical protein